VICLSPRDDVCQLSGFPRLPCFFLNCLLFKLYEKEITLGDLEPSGGSITNAALRTYQTIFALVAIVLKSKRHAHAPCMPGGSPTGLSATDARRVVAGDQQQWLRRPWVPSFSNAPTSAANVRQMTTKCSKAVSRSAGLCGIRKRR